MNDQHSSEEGGFGGSNKSGKSVTERMIGPQDMCRTCLEAVIRQWEDSSLVRSQNRRTPWAPWATKSRCLFVDEYPLGVKDVNEMESKEGIQGVMTERSTGKLIKRSTKNRNGWSRS